MTQSSPMPEAAHRTLVSMRDEAARQVARGQTRHLITWKAAYETLDDGGGSMIWASMGGCGCGAWVKVGSDGSFKASGDFDLPHPRYDPTTGKTTRTTS